MTRRPVAVITGAAGGIGGEIWRDLARTHDVVAVGRDAARLDRLRAEFGGVVRVCDLGDADARIACADAIDRVDVLVHSAGVSVPLAVAVATPADWRRHLELNVVAPAHLTSLLLPALRRSRGTVIVITSGLASRVRPGDTVYAASKHAQHALAEGLRLEEGRHGVRVTEVAPGPTATSMQATVSAGLGLEYRPDEIVQPASVARAVRLAVDAAPDAEVTDIAVRPRAGRG